MTRMDYLAPLHNELVFSLATEALLGVELPPRATWIRMLMTELNRVSSHLMWMATNGMDLGSTSMMIYGFREREMVLTFFEKTTGLRMNTNYIRPGGVAADLPDGWEDDVDIICETVLARTFEYDELLTGQPIFRDRTEGVGNITAEEALALSVTGPILRSTGVPWDLRRTMPYLAYDKLDFDVIVGRYGDNFDRYSVRLNEIRESIRMIRQIAEMMPPGDYRVQDRKVTPPPRRPHRREHGGADPPLQDLHRGLPGARGRGVHGHRVAPGRARLLPGLRRHLASRTACTSAPRASSTCRRCRCCCAAG